MNFFIFMGDVSISLKRCRFISSPSISHKTTNLINLPQIPQITIENWLNFLSLPRFSFNFLFKICHHGCTSSSPPYQSTPNQTNILFFPLSSNLQSEAILIWVLLSIPVSQMGRRSNDPEASRFTTLALLLLGFISCALVYTILSLVLNPNVNFTNSGSKSFALIEESSEDNNGGCCSGIDNLELWGAAVKWGSEFKFNSSRECCEACKAMCHGNDGPCLCDTWVFCGNKETCGSKFGEVRLHSISCLVEFYWLQLNFLFLFW